METASLLRQWNANKSQQDNVRRGCIKINFEDYGTLLSAVRMFLSPKWDSQISLFSGYVPEGDVVSTSYYFIDSRGVKNCSVGEDLTSLPWENIKCDIIWYNEDFSVSLDVFNSAFKIWPSILAGEKKRISMHYSLIWLLEQLPWGKVWVLTSRKILQ